MKVESSLAESESEPIEAIYRRYASIPPAARPALDVRLRNRRLVARWHYLDWLPADRTASCLDMGCGDGTFLSFLANEGYSRLHGVDRCAESVGEAQSSCQAAAIREGDAASFLEEHPRTFDLITAFDLLEHVSLGEALRLVSAARAALRPGGSLVIQTPNAQSLLGPTLRFADLTHRTCYTPGSLSHLLALCGFGSPEIREVEPVPHGPISAARWCAWRMLRLAYALALGVETGGLGIRVYSRNMIARARAIDGGEARSRACRS